MSLPDLSTVLAFITGGLVGLVAALRIIAPMTKNTVDDKIEQFAEKVLGILKPDGEAK